MKILNIKLGSLILFSDYLDFSLNQVAISALWSRESVMGWIVSPKSYVEVLMPSTLGMTVFGDRDFKEVKVK